MGSDKLNHGRNRAFDIEVTRIKNDRIGSLDKRCCAALRVLLVTLQNARLDGFQFRGIRLLAFLQLAHSAKGTNLQRRGHKYFQIRIRKDHRSNVTAINDSANR